MERSDTIRYKFLHGNDQWRLSRGCSLQQTGKFPESHPSLLYSQSSPPHSFPLTQLLLTGIRFFSLQSNLSYKHLSSNFFLYFNTSLSLTIHVQVVTSLSRFTSQFYLFWPFLQLEMSPPLFPMTHLNCSHGQPNVRFPGPHASSNLLLQCPD